MSEDELIASLLSLRLDAARPNPFCVLGITPSATPDEIRTAYKARSLLLHPDKNSHPLAQACFNLVVEAYEELKNRHSSELAVETENGRKGETVSFDRKSESYQCYDKLCSKMLAQINKKHSESDSQSVGNRKRKECSPIHSPSRDAMDVSGDRDDQDQSCDDDSFECDCGEEKCTCRASQCKKQRFFTENMTVGHTMAVDPNVTVGGPQMAFHPECHFASPMQMLSGLISKFYDFIDCTPSPCSLVTPTPTPNPTASLAPNTTAPVSRPKCHGLNLMRFLSSSTYNSELNSKGGVRKPCASAFFSKGKKE
jgi:hypothetical protein